MPHEIGTVAGACALLLAGGRPGRGQRTERREILSSSPTPGTWKPLALHILGEFKLQIQATQTPANPCPALHPAVLLPRTQISEPWSPVPVPALTTVLALRATLFLSCQVELITGATALAKLCLDQIMLEGEEVLA